MQGGGLTRLHVGLETGDRDLLNEIEKGATPEEMIEGGKKAKLAGFEYSLYVLLGIGGEEKWEQHARGHGRGSERDRSSISFEFERLFLSPILSCMIRCWMGGSDLRPRKQS